MTFSEYTGIASLVCLSHPTILLRLCQDFPSGAKRREQTSQERSECIPKQCRVLPYSCSAILLPYDRPGLTTSQLPFRKQHKETEFHTCCNTYRKGQSTQSKHRHENE